MQLFCQKTIAAIWLDAKRHEIPYTDGMIPGTSIEVQWYPAVQGPWTLLKASLVNRGEKPVRLGAFHLAECGEVPGTGLKDEVYLDSGGGWFAGAQQVTTRMPYVSDAEFWGGMYAPQSDIGWAREKLGRDPGPGSNYSFGSVSIYHRASDRSDFFAAFVIPLSRCNAMPIFLNDSESGNLKAVALSNNFAEYELDPAERIETEEAIIRSGGSPELMLEEYAAFCAERRNVVKRCSKPQVGWLSWYGYRLTIDEQEVDRVADFINREYPGFGFKYMQIDLGYNTDCIPGKWFGTNDHFPRGLEYFGESMRKKGFVPGLWSSPVTSAMATPLFEQHPDVRYAPPEQAPSLWFWEPRPPIANLDPTHPAAEEFIRKMIRHFKSFGVKYFKTDFLGSLGRTDGATPHDRKVVKGAQVYRHAVKLILSELDPDDYLYTCSCLSLQSIGLASTTMSACDIANTGFDEEIKKEGKRDKLDFFARQLSTTMSRWYLNEKLLIMNPDSIHIAPPATLEEARIRVSFVGISGGQVFLGDKFDQATPELRKLVRTALPPYGKAARPVGIFGHPAPDKFPEVYHLHTDEREIFAVYNFNETDTIRVDLAKAGLAPEKEYELWDFYNEQYLGRVSGSFEALVPFPAVRIYALTPATDHPVILSTSFHITQGAVELSDVQYKNGIFSGFLTRPAGDKGRIFAFNPGTGKVSRLELTGAGKSQKWEIHFMENL